MNSDTSSISFFDKLLIGSLGFIFVGLFDQLSCKIISSAVRIATGKQKKLRLGNINITRDWGWAPEYVEAMWLMLQKNKAEDFVIATGELNSLEDFVEAVFSRLGLNWKEHVIQNEEYMRPTDLKISFGDPSKAKKILGWQAQSKMRNVVRRMMA